MDFGTLTPYLSGEKFSEDLKVDLSDTQQRISRIDKILAHVKNKNIIHVGCVDHIPLIDAKIKNNEWLHKRITENCKKCIGIDINKEGINYIINKHNIKNVVFADLLTANIPEIDSSDWDVMILGEILEHVDDPVHFLNEIRKKYSKKVQHILITVPNAFSFFQYTNLVNMTEVINSDHRYYFSPYTLAKVLYKAGYKLEEVSFADPYYKFHHKVINKLAGKKLSSVNVCFSSSLIGIASFNG